MLSIWMFVAAVAAPAAEADSAKVWHADYGVALAETKQDGHPLLVVFEKPGDEQQRLEPSLLSAESGAFPLDSYALCRIDVSTEYGKEVAEGFKVKDFPHVAIIDKSGSVILRRVSGDISKAEWKDVLKKHADGLRATAVTQTVAKPVVTEGSVVTASAVVEGPVTTPTATYTPAVGLPAAVSYPAAAPARSFCPNCQLRNR
jgi:hypothetical protein